MRTELITRACVLQVVALTTVLLSLCGCGQAVEETDVAVSLPFQVPLINCTHRSDIGANLNATLYISGGYAPCALTIDSATLTASGTCPNITAGIVRPLGLEYWLPDPVNSGAPVALAYILSWADLSAMTVGAAPDVPVDMTPGVKAKLLTTPDDVAALRSIPPAPPVTDCNNPSDTETSNLCAEDWAKNDAFRTNPIDFNINSLVGSTSNLLEACNGTLFTR